MSVDRTNGMPDYNAASSSKFVPEVWSAKLIEKFYDSTVFGAIANTDYEGEIQSKGDKVIIRTRADIIVSDYQVNMELAYQHAESEATELAIDKAKYFAFELKDVDEVQSDIALMDEWASDGSEQMKIAIDRSVLEGIVDQADAYNRGGTAGRISGDIDLGENVADGAIAIHKANVTDFLVDCGTILDEQNIPESGRWVVLPAWACGMIKKSELKDASITGDSKSIMRNGRLGMIDRFTIYSSNLLPSAATAGGQYIYFGHKVGITFASQITKMETVRNTRDFGDFVRSLQVYGFKVTKPEGLGQGVIENGGNLAGVVHTVAPS